MFVILNYVFTVLIIHQRFIHIKSNSIQQLFTHIQSFCSSLILFNDSNDYKICITFNLLFVWITEQRLVMMSVSLCTQTRLHCLIIQALNIRVCFPNIWYTSVTFVHSNLGNGLAILTESFSPLKSELHNFPCWSPNFWLIWSQLIYWLRA